MADLKNAVVECPPDIQLEVLARKRNEKGFMHPVELGPKYREALEKAMLAAWQSVGKVDG